MNNTPETDTAEIPIDRVDVTASRPACIVHAKEKVVAHESMMRLVQDLEGWANARIAEFKEAKQQDRFMPYHNENYFCAMGQLDAADRIMDILREESFLANVKDHSPIGAVGASNPESNSTAPIG
jgi:hypothetical protein